MLYQRLIYRSRAVATQDRDKVLSQILDVANRHNRAHGITGALTLYDDCFIQVIEGPPAQIDRLMAILECDPRHRDVQVLGRWAASHRLFGGWAMANAHAFEMSVETRKILKSATCGLEMVTVLFGLASGSPLAL